MSKKMCVYNNKGGVGKSTTAAQLAYGFSKLKKKTLLINLDGQNDSISFLGIRKDKYNKTFYDLIDKRYPAKIEECIISTRDYLDVLPSSNLQKIESEFNMESRIDLIMKEVLIGLENKDYEYIIVDCGPQPGKVNTAILCYVSFIIMPVQLEYASVVAAGNVFDYLKELRLNPEMVAAVIPNMYDRTTKHSSRCLDLLKKTFSEDILTESIPLRVSIKDAGAMGKSIFEYDKKIATIFMPILRKVVEKVG